VSHRSEKKRSRGQEEQKKKKSPQKVHHTTHGEPCLKGTVELIFFSQGDESVKEGKKKKLLDLAFRHAEGENKINKKHAGEI